MWTVKHSLMCSTIVHQRLQIQNTFCSGFWDDAMSQMGLSKFVEIYLNDFVSRECTRTAIGSDCCGAKLPLLLPFTPFFSPSFLSRLPHLSSPTSPSLLPFPLNSFPEFSSLPIFPFSLPQPKLNLVHFKWKVWHLVSGENNFSDIHEVLYWLNLVQKQKTFWSISPPLKSSCIGSLGSAGSSPAAQAEPDHQIVSSVEWRGPTLGTGNWLSSTCVSAISVIFNDQLQSKSIPNPYPTLQLSNPSITHPNSLQTLNTHLFILYISLLCLSDECFPAFLLSI